jgi:hypothetical protein
MSRAFRKEIEIGIDNRAVREKHIRALGPVAPFAARPARPRLAASPLNYFVAAAIPSFLEIANSSPAA